MIQLQNFLNQEECDYLIDLINKDNRKSTVVGHENAKSVYDQKHRTSSTCDLSNNDEKVRDIHKKIADNLGFDISRGETLQGQMYNPGQYFRQHHDYFQGEHYDRFCLTSGNRVKTFMIYLNDDCKGGDTNFPKLNLSIKPEKGKAVIWDNMIDGELNPNSMHEGTDVIEGTKYIITSWWRENAWQPHQDEMMYRNRNKKVYIKHSDLPKCTDTGFKVIKCPEEVWSLIQDSYEELKKYEREEIFDNKKDFLKGSSLTNILDIGNIPGLRNKLHNKLQKLHEDFCGQKLEPTCIYGIRSYKRGVTLETHRDRIETHHISSVIIVDKDLRCGCKNKRFGNDWPLDIQDHNGNWHKVYAKVGDIILYEGGSLEHGRLEPFEGLYFNNLFVHYKLV